MSSLRLALKQSLEEAKPSIRHEQKQKDKKDISTATSTSSTTKKLKYKDGSSSSSNVRVNRPRQKREKQKAKLLKLKEKEKRKRKRLKKQQKIANNEQPQLDDNHNRHDHDGSQRKKKKKQKHNSKLDYDDDNENGDGCNTNDKFDAQNDKDTENNYDKEHEIEFDNDDKNIGDHNINSTSKDHKIIRRVKKKKSGKNHQNDVTSDGNMLFNSSSGSSISSSSSNSRNNNISGLNKKKKKLKMSLSSTNPTTTTTSKKDIVMDVSTTDKLKKEKKRNKKKKLKHRHAGEKVYNDDSNRDRDADMHVDVGQDHIDADGNGNGDYSSHAILKKDLVDPKRLMQQLQLQRERAKNKNQLVSIQQQQHDQQQQNKQLSLQMRKKKMKQKDPISINNSMSMEENNDDDNNSNNYDQQKQTELSPRHSTQQSQSIPTLKIHGPKKKLKLTVKKKAISQQQQPTKSVDRSVDSPIVTSPSTCPHDASTNAIVANVPKSAAFDSLSSEGNSDNNDASQSDSSSSASSSSVDDNDSSSSSSSNSDSSSDSDSDDSSTSSDDDDSSSDLKSKSSSSTSDDYDDPRFSSPYFEGKKKAKRGRPRRYNEDDDDNGNVSSNDDDADMQGVFDSERSSDEEDSDGEALKRKKHQSELRMESQTKQKKESKQKYPNHPYNTSSDESDANKDDTCITKMKKKTSITIFNSSASPLPCRDVSDGGQNKVKDTEKSSFASISTKTSKCGSVKRSKSNSSSTSTSTSSKEITKKKDFASDDDDENKSQPTISTLHSSTVNFKESKRKRKQKSVIPPTKELLAWVMGMSQSKQRNEIASGMRVKVRFTKPQLKWYGGVVTLVSPAGSKIKILYDDGTKEVSNFPDKEIVVDDCGNGRHEVDAAAFQPKELLSTSIPLSVPTKKIVRSILNDGSSQQSHSPLEIVKTQSNDSTNSTPVGHDEEKPSKEDISKVDVIKSDTQRKEDALKPSIASDAKEMPSTENVNVGDSGTALKDSASQVNMKEIGDLTSAVILHKESISAKCTTDNLQSIQIDDKASTALPKDKATAKVVLPLLKSPDESIKDCLNEDAMIGEGEVEAKTSTNADKLRNTGSSDEHDVALVKLETQEAINGDLSISTDSIMPMMKTESTTKSSVGSISPKSATPKSPKSDSNITSETSQHGSNKLILNRRPLKGIKKLQQDENPEQKLAPKKRKRDKNEDGRRRKKRNDETVDVWVSCDRCSKWRLIPSDVNLPKQWYCEMNEFDPERNTCDAPEQSHEEVTKVRRKHAKKAGDQSIKLKRAKSSSPMTVSKRSESNSSALKPENKDKAIRSNSPVVYKSLSELTKDSAEEETRGGANDGSDGFSGATKIKNNKRNRQGRDEEGKPKKKGRKPKETKQQEWVQCEKCDKWRRLPSHIKAKDLPDTWYCSMNHWDPRSASCAVQDDVKIEKPAPPDRGGIQLPGPPVGSNTPSYRDLIGNKPPAIISEKKRAAESIFSSHAGEHEGEASGPPVVTYINSSAFQQKVSANRVHANNYNNEHAPLISEMTLFSLMSHTKLWKDLLKLEGDQSYSEELMVMTSNNIAQVQEREVIDRTHLQSSESSTSMKAMVHYALSRGPMSSDEVLFECQCGDWKDMPWTNLRAWCTIDSIMSALYELMKDGLVEEVKKQSDETIDCYMDTMSPKRFQHVKIKGSPSSLSPGLTPLKPLEQQQVVVEDAKVVKKQSRFIKFSKPWKKNPSCSIQV